MTKLLMKKVDESIQAHDIRRRNSLLWQVFALGSSLWFTTPLLEPLLQKLGAQKAQQFFHEANSFDHQLPDRYRGPHGQWAAFPGQI